MEFFVTESIFKDISTIDWLEVRRCKTVKYSYVAAADDKVAHGYNVKTGRYFSSNENENIDKQDTDTVTGYLIAKCQYVTIKLPVSTIEQENTTTVNITLEED